MDVWLIFIDMPGAAIAVRNMSRVTFMFERGIAAKCDPWRIGMP